MKKMQIFTCHHKPGIVFENDVIFPIHVGKALSQYELKMLCDNMGDNISEKNPFYCELTAIYFIWKNIKADYVGLFHYRRLLNFKTIDTKCYNLTPTFLDDYGINRAHIETALSNVDIILPKKTKNIKLSLYDFYARDHIISDLDCVLEVIRNKYPQMYEIAEDVLKNNSRGYFANIFVTSKKLFDEYASWLFDILFEVENCIQADVLTRDAYQQRVYGFLSERMMSIFIEYKKQAENIKIKELPCLFIEDNKKKWKKYKIKMLFFKILTAIGLGKKSWHA